MKTEILIPNLKNTLINVHDLERCEKEYEYEWHLHNEIEMYYTVRGNKYFYVNDKKYHLSDGDIIFVNSNVAHKTYTEENCEGLILQFLSDNTDNDLYKYLFHFINASCEDAVLFRRSEPVTDELKSCFENIIAENEKKDKAYNIFIKAEVTKIIAILNRCDILKNPYDFFSTENIQRIFPVLEYIDKNYREHISLEDMSNLINVDKFHFCKIFKKAVNTSFIHYTNFVKICKAEKLLISTDLCISEISEDTGFSSTAYFTELFKLYKGCAPTKYRQYKKYPV